MSLGYDRSLTPYPYDPARARTILGEIGYDGKPVKLWAVRFGASPEAPEIMELVHGYLQAAGFKAELTPQELGAFRPRYISRPQKFETTYAAHLLVDTPFARPMVLSNMAISWISHEAGGVMQGHWNLPKIDNSFRQLIQNTDLKVLDTELRKLNHESYAEHVAHPVVARNEVFAAGPRIGDWSPGDYGVAWHLETLKKK
jgi:ABC-type transport system substrate-binding protein